MQVHPFQFHNIVYLFLTQPRQSFSVSTLSESSWDLHAHPPSLHRGNIIHNSTFPGHHHSQSSDHINVVFITLQTSIHFYERDHVLWNVEPGNRVNVFMFIIHFYRSILILISRSALLKLRIRFTYDHIFLHGNQIAIEQFRKDSFFIFRHFKPQNIN